MLGRTLSVASIPRRIYRMVRREGFRSIVERVAAKLNPGRSQRWLARFLPTDPEILRQQAKQWPSRSPRIGIVIPLVASRDDRRLHSAFWSVLRQSYPHFEIVALKPEGDSSWGDLAARCKLFGDWPQRVRLQTWAQLRASDDLDYLIVVHPEDNLETHAAFVLARAIAAQSPDVLYSDEILTSGSLRVVRRLTARSAFSLERWVSSPEIENLVCFRFGLLAGMNEADLTRPVARMAALLVQNPRLTHVADFLYRRRARASAETHASVRDRVAAVSRHFGLGDTVRTASESRNLFAPDRALPADYRVAVIVPTRNGLNLVRPCVESLERTLPARRAEIVLIDHQSDDPACTAWLALMASRHTVVPYTGAFNFAAIMNFAVRSLSGPYTHYLLLNNDTEAPHPGWLEAMVRLAVSPGVGAVGATLLYPGPTIQHAGVVLDLQGPCGHVHRLTPIGDTADPAEWPGELAVVRECTAVTAACCLIPADVWAAVGGMNEGYRVVYNDIDLCLRIRAAGYRILQTPHAVLYHYESRTRGTTAKYPGEVAAFIDAYGDLLEAGDEFYSPYLSRVDTDPVLDPSVRWSWVPRCRTVQVAAAGAIAGRSRAA